MEARLPAAENELTGKHSGALTGSIPRTQLIDRAFGQRTMVVVIEHTPSGGEKLGG